MEYDVKIGFVLKMVGFICGIFLLLFPYSSGIEPGCTNCGCCINKECSREFVDGYYLDEYCTQGCISGYGGNKCYGKCPRDCLTCEQTIANNCATCEERKYVNEDKRCVNCPNNCKTCTSATRCQECNSPYYNDGSIQDCSFSCPRNCLCENLGVCSSCLNGFYNVGNTCRNACPITCKTCTDESHCQSCKLSYSGDICCVKNGHCPKCSSSTVCEKCSDGYYGDQCGRACPKKCSLCNRENGDCLRCHNGYYGSECGLYCPIKCYNSICIKENGNCLSCQDGYYGEKCEKTCPKTCRELQCEKDSGDCLTCNVGVFGNYCTHNCSKTCLNKRCNKQTGHCTEGCMVGYTGVNCTEVSICKEDTAASATYNGIGTVIGISATILVIIVTIVIMVSVIIVRRWKRYQNTTNEASYVNTQLQTTSVEAIDVSVKNDQIDQSQYEILGERNDKQSDEYDQIKSMNQ